MNRTPAHLLESIAVAKATMATLHGRASASDDFHDRAELSVLHTTVRRIEELLHVAVEYEALLQRQLARTNARIESGSSHDLLR